MAYLQITLQTHADDRDSAAEVYSSFRERFLRSVPGAVGKRLLTRAEDVQVLHEFASSSDAEAYVASEFFTTEVVTALAPLLSADPDVRIYRTA